MDSNQDHGPSQLRVQCGDLGLRARPYFQILTWAASLTCVVNRYQKMLTRQPPFRGETAAIKEETVGPFVICSASGCRSESGALEAQSCRRFGGRPDAYHQDEVGIFSIDPVDMIAGSLRSRQRRLVEAWAELHQPELRADWQHLQEGRRADPIDPLR